MAGRQGDIGMDRPPEAVPSTIQVREASGATTSCRVDLAREIERVRATDSWRRGMRATRTLLKNADPRLVLVAYHAGDRLAAHQAPCGITIHTLSGEVRVGLPGRTVAVPAGQVLAIEAGIVHDVDAPMESVFLLTVAATADRATPFEQETA